MALSSDLLLQFAKITNNDSKETTETTVYGTIVESNGSKYVKIDGSEILTPILSTADVKADERVTVMIKNHTAIVNGNISSPAARTDDVIEIGDKVTEIDANKISAVEADFKYATIENLDATNATITNLNSKYANIDFTNIGSAAIEQFFSKSGMISDLVVGDNTVTGTLVGVTIIGDSIQGGTVIADKLVVLGTDGIYYKLNTDGVNIEAEQTESNSLNGSIITANSITASKISVNDLVAFNATIGGFNITDSSIYSGVKESIHNTTTGIYLDDEGQIAFGDTSNFLKFYKADDGKYKLEISAKSILFSSGSNVETALNDLALSTQNLQNTVNTSQQNLETYIRFDADGMELGKVNSPFMAELSNQELAFLQNGNKVAYINDNKLYITDAEVVDSLKIGSFQYVPRANGNTSFKWIGGS